MSGIKTLCRICGKPASHTCSMCGKHVCSAHYDVKSGICENCKHGKLVK